MFISVPMFLERVRTVLLFPLRSAVFLIGLYAYWMETAADFVIGATSSTEYVRKGSCRKCGRCCKLLAVEMPKFMAKRAWMVRLAMVWHDLAFNFEPAGVMDRYLVYRCRYYRDGCSIYPFRHRLCRFFPKQHLYGKYDVGDDCGFSFVKRDVMKRIRARRRRGEKVFGEVLGEKSCGGGAPCNRERAMLCETDLFKGEADGR